jgi:hypothetical protein
LSKNPQIFQKYTQNFGKVKRQPSKNKSQKEFGVFVPKNVSAKSILWFSYLNRASY